MAEVRFCMAQIHFCMAEVRFCMVEVRFCIAEALGGQGFPPSQYGTWVISSSRDGLEISSRSLFIINNNNNLHKI